jgi:hypothetical protein
MRIGTDSISIGREVEREAEAGDKVIFQSVYGRQRYTQSLNRAFLEVAFKRVYWRQRPE